MSISDKSSPQEIAEEILSQQITLRKRIAELEDKMGDDFKEYQKLQAALADTGAAWDAVREMLEKAGDYDNHEVVVNGNRVKFSLSKSSRVSVVDIEKVPEEFVSVEKVANPKKLTDYYKLYGEVPAGCEDKSFTRFIKKEDNNEN